MSLHCFETFGSWRDTPKKAANSNVNKIGGHVVLAVGLGENATARTALHAANSNQIITVSSAAELSQAMLTAFAPLQIYVPLMCLKNDVLGVANWLHRSNYTGTLCVLSPKLPKPKMVAMEIQAACPSVKVEIAFEDQFPVSLSALRG